MSNRRRIRREMRQSRGKRRWVTRYTADELHQMLVADAVDGHGPNSAPSLEQGMTYMNWCVAAYVRIAALRRIPIDDAYLSVENEVKGRTGRPMPL